MSSTWPCFVCVGLVAVLVRSNTAVALVPSSVAMVRCSMCTPVYISACVHSSVYYLMLEPAVAAGGPWCFSRWVGVCSGTCVVQLVVRCGCCVAVLSVIFLTVAWHSGM